MALPPSIPAIFRTHLPLFKAYLVWHDLPPFLKKSRALSLRFEFKLAIKTLRNIDYNCLIRNSYV